jgi:hypothetical protein
MIKLQLIARRFLPITEGMMSMDAVYELQDELQYKIFQDFLYENNDDMTGRVPWQLIKFPRLQKIWNDFIKIGGVRDEKGLDEIEGIMVRNALKINIFTILTGHTPQNPDEDFDEHFSPYLDEFIKYYKTKDAPLNQYQMNFNRKSGKASKSSLPDKVPVLDNKYLIDYIEEKELEDLSIDELKEKLKDALLDRFYWYYSEDPKSGHAYISDYGLKPLLQFMSQLIGTDDTSQKLYTIDKMLNVVHQRSDLASWFVEGGSNALSKLSGTDTDD